MAVKRPSDHRRLFVPIMFSRLPTSIRWRTLTIALLALLAMLAVGCGSDAQNGESADAGDAYQAGADTSYDSPLGDFLGPSFGFGASDEQERSQWLNQEAERRTIECMAKLGFKYFPSQEVPSIAATDRWLEWGSRAWIETYGFGVSTRFLPQSQVGPSLAGYTDEPDFSGTIDPNQEYLESLSQAELQSFSDALSGAEDSDSNGCSGRAHREVFETESPDAQLFVAFGDELVALRQKALSDPRVLEYDTMVSRCVAEAGLNYVSETATQEEIWQRLAPLEDSAMSTSRFELAGLDPATMTDGDRRAFEAASPTPALSNEAKDLLSAIQSDEIALAMVVDDCAGSTRKRIGYFNEIWVEFENEFLETHGTELEVFRDSLGS